MSINYNSPDGILRLARARASMVWPYLSHAIFSLIPVKVNFREKFGMHPTMGVDQYWRLYWDEEAVAEWGLDITTSAFRHEAEHLLRLHGDRAKSAGVTDHDHTIWNVAADCAINDGLLREIQEHRKEREARRDPKSPPLVDMGKDWMLPKLFKLQDDLIEEEYFEHLKKLASTCTMACGSGAHGQPMPWEMPAPHSSRKDVPGLSRAEGDYIRNKTAEAIRNESSKSRGTVPSDWVRWADEVLEPPKVDWRHELRGVVRCAVHEVSGQVDYSYSRPTRRQDAYGDIIMPSMRRPIPRVAVFGDTSGSMGDEDIAHIPAEIEGICRALGASVFFISVDADVHVAQEVHRGRAVKLKGGGGTDMRLGFEAALKAKPRPDIIIGITDCETPWPDEPPPRCRTIIVRVRQGSSAPSWARVVDVT